MGKRMRKRRALVLFFWILMTLSACSMRKNPTEKVKDVDVKVLESFEIPQELKEQMKRQEGKEWKLTYKDQGKLYITRSYGEKITDGYKVHVKTCYETKNGIYFQTELAGPEKGRKVNRKKTNPYVAVEIQTEKEEVYFQ